MAGKKPTELDPIRGERIKSLREKQKLSQAALAEVIGVSRPAITQIESGNAFTLDNAIRLSKALKTDINTLLTGEVSSAYYSADSGVPYYDIDASAGPIEMFNDTPEVIKSRILIPGFEDCDIAINVWGDSMYPHYRAGNMVICKKVEDKGLILYGEVYLVITPEFRTIKYLKKNDNPRLVTLRSANDKYDDVDIEVDKILRLYHVKGKIERNAI